MRIFGHLTIHWLRRKSPNWRIAAKLQLQPNYKILDIGCDWDGLAVTLSSIEPGISLTGITFSENQHAYATTVVKPKPQARYIHYEHPDYRHQTGHFEKIVSIGRLEHIAATHLNSYFAGIARLLPPNGIFPCLFNWCRPQVAPLQQMDQ